MNGSRFAPLTAVLFVILWIAGIFVSRTPDNADGASVVAEFYKDSSNRNMAVAGAYLWIAAAFLLLCFFVCVRERLLAAEGGSAPLTALAFGSGAISVSLILVGTFALAAVPAGVAFGGVDPPTDGNITIFTQQLGYGAIFAGSMIAAAVSIFVTSVATRRTGALPGWTAWLGFIAAVVLVFAVVWIPQIALLIWAIAIGIALRKPAPAAAS